MLATPELGEIRANQKMPLIKICKITDDYQMSKTE